MKTVWQVWYVRGDGDKLLLATKEDAEAWARECYPDEDANKRYARIFYRNVESFRDSMELDWV